MARGRHTASHICLTPEDRHTPLAWQRSTTIRAAPDRFICCPARGRYTARYQPACNLSLVRAILRGHATDQPCRTQD
jgi:hypothetical protein